MVTTIGNGVGMGSECVVVHSKGNVMRKVTQAILATILTIAMAMTMTMAMAMAMAMGIDMSMSMVGETQGEAQRPTLDHVHE